jgi:hypothetical protein
MFDLFLRPQRSLPARVVGLLIRLRAEILVVAVLLTARFWVWPRLDTRLGHVPALLLTTALILGVLVVPASRRYLLRRWRCVCTRHRVRAALLKSRYSSSMTYDGKLPYLLWSRPSPIGERIRVWLPAGLSVKDLERSTDVLAAACWARSARFTPVRGQAALVVLDIIRRDPLDGTIPVQSDTTGDADDMWDGTPNEDDADVMGQLIPLPARDPATSGTAASGADHATPAPPAPRPATGGKARTAATANTETPSARGVGGMDVSDYV